MRMPGHHRVTGSGDGRPATAGRASPAGGDGEILLRVRGLGKNFGPVQALADVTLDFPAGQVTALGRLVTVGPTSDFDTAAAVHWMTVGAGPDGQAGKYDKQDAIHQA